LLSVVYMCEFVYKWGKYRWSRRLSAWLSFSHSEVSDRSIRYDVGLFQETFALGERTDAFGGVPSESLRQRLGAPPGEASVVRRRGRPGPPGGARPGRRPGAAVQGRQRTHQVLPSTRHQSAQSAFACS